MYLILLHEMETKRKTIPNLPEVSLPVGTSRKRTLRTDSESTGKDQRGKST